MVWLLLDEAHFLNLMTKRVPCVNHQDDSSQEGAGRQRNSAGCGEAYYCNNGSDTGAEHIRNEIITLQDSALRTLYSSNAIFARSKLSASMSPPLKTTSLC